MNNPLIYVAGPYRATTENGVFENIIEARRIAMELWKQGWTPICPHLNSAFMGGVVPDSEFLQRDLVLLYQCDAIFADARSKSLGTQAELAFAILHNIHHVELFTEAHYLLQDLRDGAKPMRSRQVPTPKEEQK